MRTFKFRGKGIKSGQWFYGSVVPFGNSAYIFKMFRLLRMEHAEVDPATVGQFTGLFDKDGKEIYEGDIIKEDNLVHKILWIDEASAFCRCDLEYMDIRYRISRDAMSYVEIIGNIHDNKDLLNEATSSEEGD